MSVHLHVYADPLATSEACARGILQLLEEKLAGDGQAALAISGGSTPQLLFREIAGVRFDWSNVHLFFADERGVPPNDPQSNYKLAKENLIDPANIPSRNVHRVHAELTPNVAARLYAGEIQEFFELSDGAMPHFDIIHRGMGADGHTASLFPGDALIDDRENLVRAVYVEKLKQWRITLLPAVLRAARHTIMLITGAGKAETLREVLCGDYEPKKYPAQIGVHDARSVSWFLDEAAARFVKN